MHIILTKNCRDVKVKELLEGDATVIAQVDYKSFTEHQVISMDNVNRALVMRERALEELFKKQVSQKEMVRTLEPHMRKPLLTLIDQDPEARSKLQELREISQKQRFPQLRAPKAPREYQRTSATPTGMTRVPPFDNQWTWSHSKGECEVQVTADKEQGDTSLLLSTLNFQEGIAQGVVGVGVQFSPIVTGNVHIWANPSFSFEWAIHCLCSHAGTMGWIGLHVDSYDMSGSFAGSPVNQHIHLWREKGWIVCERDFGSTTGYPLSADLFVDTDHNYIFWVQAGGFIEADGSGPAGSMSNSLASMSITVPSITWELR